METTRYVALDSEAVDVLLAACGAVQGERARQVLADIAARYEASDIACVHRRVLRSGAGRKCCDCGAWI